MALTAEPGTIGAGAFFMAKSGSLPPGTRMGVYELRRFIGAGGMGEVYEAEHTGLRKAVAIKLLRVDSEEGTDARTRFLREGETASRIRHPNVVDITDLGEHDGQPYLVMELLEGETLAQYLQREKPLSIGRAVDLLLPVVAAVGAAHDHGVVHRDLKPDNVFLAEDARGDLEPKVLDFGISKRMHEDDAPELTMTTSLLGTPYYMAPEQAEGAKHADERSDQYAVGVMLYEAVLGRRPHERHGYSFVKLLQAISQGNFDLPRSIKPDLPLDFEDVMLRAMSVDPEKRYGSMTELGAALLPFATGRQQALWRPVFSGYAETLMSRPSNAVPLSGRPASDFDETIDSTEPDLKLPPIKQSAGSEPQALTPGATIRTRGDTVSARRPLGVIVIGTLLVLGTAAVISVLANDAESVEPGAPSAALAPISAAPDSAASFRLRLKVDPPDALIQLDGRNVAVGELDRQFSPDGQLHKLRVSREGYEPQVLAFKDQPPAIEQLELDKTEGDAATDAGPASSAAPPPSPSAELGRRPHAGQPSEARAPEPDGPGEDSKSPPSSVRTDNIDPWAK